MKTTGGEVIRILRKIDSGEKAISRHQWFNWLEPYRVTVGGVKIRPELCDRLYGERLLIVTREHAGRMYLVVSDKAKMRYLTARGDEK